MSLEVKFPGCVLFSEKANTYVHFSCNYIGLGDELTIQQQDAVTGDKTTYGKLVPQTIAQRDNKLIGLARMINLEPTIPQGKFGFRLKRHPLKFWDLVSYEINHEGVILRRP